MSQIASKPFVKLAAEPLPQSSFRSSGPSQSSTNGSRTWLPQGAVSWQSCRAHQVPEITFLDTVGLL